ncbi:hypothetical protein BU23DRAFT_556446 [Bimuria novae-zelandiae CBS 107.79]|uniref:Uncharacterized protein n=1 Tax=Bimuria novae-zelandiae CBS 107.79 TaxID=1447943 RepID=A0A6A5V228_9PLEO|nr:hypothetical protein BU23DRAFT_556446 [Bimuria novae-zelandiae CBS 107.79]
MPPRIPVRFPWTASNGINSTLTGRSFSSTAPTLALGPESPNYVEVPKPLQPTFPRKPLVKGHLPVPRDVFKTRSDIPKESDQFLAQSTREPKKPAQPGPWSKDAEYRLYKQRLADARKKALREGVKELHARKVETDQAFTAQIQASNAERRRLALAPPRQVDVLTQTSVSKGVRDFLGGRLPETPRVVFAAQRRKAYEKRLARQEAVRRSRLHDLYTNAREFIVNEEQLDEAIEKAFGTEEMPVRFHPGGAVSPTGTGVSAWEGGPPEGVAEKLQSLMGGEGTGVGLAKERIKKVAEALTGGKM